MPPWNGEASWACRWRCLLFLRWRAVRIREPWSRVTRRRRRPGAGALRAPPSRTSRIKHPGRQTRRRGRGASSSNRARPTGDTACDHLPRAGGCVAGEPTAPAPIPCRAEGRHHVLVLHAGRSRIVYLHAPRRRRVPRPVTTRATSGRSTTRTTLRSKADAGGPPDRHQGLRHEATVCGKDVHHLHLRARRRHRSLPHGRRREERETPATASATTAGRSSTPTAPRSSGARRGRGRGASSTTTARSWRRTWCARRSSSSTWPTPTAPIRCR